MRDLDQAKALLTAGGYTCVLCRGERVETSTLRGVRPLVALCQGEKNFCGFAAADRVVGRATAFLYVRLGVAALYAGVLSNSALSVLTEHHIPVVYDTLAEYIINRSGDGMCPFEEAVWKISDPERAYEIICEKLRGLS